MFLVGRHKNIEVAVDGESIMHKIRDKWVKAEGRAPEKCKNEMNYEYRIRVMYEYIEFNTLPLVRGS